MLVEVDGGGVNEDDDLGIVELDTDVFKALEILLSSDEVAARLRLVELVDGGCVWSVVFVKTCLRISCRRR